MAFSGPIRISCVYNAARKVFMSIHINLIEAVRKNTSECSSAYLPIGLDVDPVYRNTMRQYLKQCKSGRNQLAVTIIT